MKKQLCPHCQKLQPASHFSCVSGSMGGKAGTGKSKTRTKEQARKAGLASAAARRKKAKL